jgi:hypothetical protein
MAKKKKFKKFTGAQWAQIKRNKELRERWRQIPPWAAASRSRRQGDGLWSPVFKLKDDPPYKPDPSKRIYGAPAGSSGLRDSSKLNYKKPTSGR